MTGRKIKLPPLDNEALVIPVLLGADHIDVGINPSLGFGAGKAGRFADPLLQGFRLRRQAIEPRGNLAVLRGVRVRERRGGVEPAEEEEKGEGNGRRRLRRRGERRECAAGE